MYLFNKNNHVEHSIKNMGKTNALKCTAPSVGLIFLFFKIELSTLVGGLMRIEVKSD